MAKESEYFSYKGEDYAGVFPEKKEKLCTILQMLLNKKNFGEEEQDKHWPEKTGHTYENEFIEADKKLL